MTISPATSTENLSGTPKQNFYALSEKAKSGKFKKDSFITTDAKEALLRAKNLDVGYMRKIAQLGATTISSITTFGLTCGAIYCAYKFQPYTKDDIEGVAKDSAGKVMNGLVSAYGAGAAIAAGIVVYKAKDKAEELALHTAKTLISISVALPFFIAYKSGQQVNHWYEKGNEQRVIKAEKERQFAENNTISALSRVGDRAIQEARKTSAAVEKATVIRSQKDTIKQQLTKSGFTDLQAAKITSEFIAKLEDAIDTDCLPTCNTTCSEDDSPLRQRF